MGLLMIFLGLLTAGVVADYIAENHILNDPNQTVLIFGTRVTVSGVAPLLMAFAAGMVALLFIVIGIGLLRGSWGRRRNLKNRIADLEQQNTELRSRQRLQEVVDATQSKHFVELPESELAAAPEPPAEPQPSTAPSASEEIGASS